jgi:uncharacterized protein (TIGR02145 family)
MSLYLSFTDQRDNQTYRTVKIGDLVWMAQNLNYEIDNSWYYKNPYELPNEKYGRLYTWDSALKACPNGWHLPSLDEWKLLMDAAGGKSIAGKKLKSKSGWNNVNGTDEFGFSALPGGYRQEVDDFSSEGSYGFWWSATENGDSCAYRLGMSSEDGIGEQSYSKNSGNSVRCVQD